MVELAIPWKFNQAYFSSISSQTQNEGLAIVMQYVLLFGRWLEDFLNFAPDFVTPYAHNVEENVSIVNVQLKKKGRFSSLK